MVRRLLVLWIVWTAAAASGLAHAGAWTPTAGSIYSRYSVRSFESTEDFDESGRRAPRSVGGRFVDRSGGWYVEYGLLDRLAFIGNFAVKRIVSESGAHSEGNFGVGDTELGVRYRIHQGRAVLSGQLLGKFSYAYEHNAGLPLGNGQEDVEARLQLGRGFSRLYFGLEAGYRYRASTPSDQLRYMAEIGVNATANLSFRTKLDGTVGMEDGDPASDPKRNPMLSNAYDLGRWELTSSYRFAERWTWEVTYVTHVYGRNIGAGSSAEIAFACAY